MCRCVSDSMHSEVYVMNFISGFKNLVSVWLQQRISVFFVCRIKWESSSCKVMEDWPQLIGSSRAVRPCRGSGWLCNDHERGRVGTCDQVWHAWHIDWRVTVWWRLWARVWEHYSRCGYTSTSGMPQFLLQTQSFSQIFGFIETPSLHEIPSQLFPLTILS